MPRNYPHRFLRCHFIVYMYLFGNSFPSVSPSVCPDKLNKRMQHLQIHKKIHSTTPNRPMSSHLETSRYREFSLLFERIGIRLSDTNCLINWIGQNEVPANWPLWQPTKIWQTGSQLFSMKYIFSPDGRSFWKKIRTQSATSRSITPKWSFSGNLHWVL